MAIDNINVTDNLNQGRIKLNEAIEQANTVQGQLDTIIIGSGTSDAETIQARGGQPLLYNRLDASDAQLAEIAKIPPNLVSDKLTDNTTVINDYIATLIAPDKIYLPLGTKWDYDLIVHPDDITIIDDSTYDWDLDMWTAQFKSIVKSSSPGTKNANEKHFTSPYHPAWVVDVRDPSGRTSYIHRRQGQGTWQEMSDLYNGHNVYIIKDLASQGTPMVFEILGGSTSKNEFAFNSVPALGVTSVIRSRVVGTNINRLYSSGVDKDTMQQIWADTLETYRVTYKVNGDVEFNSRIGLKSITFLANGSIKWGENGKTFYNGTKPTSPVQGDIWFRPNAQLGLEVGEVCIVGGVTPTWEKFGSAGYRSGVVSPVGVVVPWRIGEEYFDTVAETWYKATGTTNAKWKAITA